ncbi:MAG TPA: xylulokinase [Candidatus Binatia bacterium]|nr:xylulokinase [Candidatus Binatia bacterium]
MTDLLCGLDLGTTGVRALAVTPEGAVVAEASASYPVLAPRPGWTEQRPEDWLEASQSVLSRVAREAAGEIVALGLTGQMHGSVFLDGSDAPLRPALLWNDQRTHRQCELMTERVGAQRLLDITGNRALTGFQAPKILWLRDEEPDAYRQVSSVLLPKDYLRLWLTGERLTDASDASGTLLLDLAARDWSAEVLERLELPEDWFPEVLEGPHAAGRVRPDVARSLGLREGIPVAAGGGDNAAAAVGTGIVREGLASSSIGTSGVLFAHTDAARPDPSGRLHAFCHAVPDRYHLMGVTLAAGGSFGWWSGVLAETGAELDFDRLTELAGEAPAGAEGLLFLPYLFGERTPHLDPFARGSFFGLTGRHGLRHLTRAVMEGVVLSLRDCLDLMIARGVRVSELRVTGGGSRHPLWRRLQADAYGVPVRRPVADQGPAYGAALLAGVAGGVFADVEDATRVVAAEPDELAPDPAASALYETSLELYRSLYPATHETMRRLADLGGA